VADGRGPDRIEREGEGFLRRVREGYLSLAASEPSAVVLPAAASPDEVHHALVRTVRSLFPEPFFPPAG
jgi:thymidylate kinase